MLFDLRHFEQSFNERTLKKGLRLFESGGVEVIGGKQAGVTELFISDTFALRLKTKGDKLLAYTCSCGKSDLCEHLAAALFYFQKDALGFSVKKKTFEKRPVKKQKSDVLKTGFERYKEKVAELLYAYRNSKALNQSQLTKIYSALTALKEEAQSAGQSYDLNLAFALALPSLFNLRILGNELPVKEFIKTTLKELDHEFGSRLNESQKAAWRIATFESLQNNTMLRSDLFLFLVPRFLSVTNNPQLFARLNTLLQARKYKQSYDSRFNKLLIAQLEVAVRELQLFKKSLSAENKEAVVELLVAGTELDLCNHKITTAFNRLKLQEETIRKKYAFYYSAYLDYCIDKAFEKGQAAMELHYLKNSFIYNPYILPAYTERFLSLVPAEELNTELHEIISGIRNHRTDFVFEKLSDLLFQTGRFDELLVEIKKQKHAFSLLHKVLMKQLPHYDLKTLGFYMDQLRDAIADAGSYPNQFRVFNKALQYLDRLPQDIKRDLIFHLLEREGTQRQIYKYISSI